MEFVCLLVGWLVGQSVSQSVTYLLRWNTANEYIYCISCTDECSYWEDRTWAVFVETLIFLLRVFRRRLQYIAYVYTCLL